MMRSVYGADYEPQPTNRPDPRVKMYQTLCSTILERLPGYSITVEAGFVLAFADTKHPRFCFTVLPGDQLKIWVHDNGKSCEATFDGFLSDPLQQAVWMLTDLRDGKVKP
jgi:hypothetical protein